MNQQLDTELHTVFEHLINQAPEAGAVPGDRQPSPTPADRHNRVWMAAAAVLIVTAGIAGLVTIASNLNNTPAAETPRAGSVVAPSSSSALPTATSPTPDVSISTPIETETNGSELLPTTPCAAGTCFVYNVQQDEPPEVVAQRFCATLDEFNTVNDWQDIAEWPSPGSSVFIPVVADRSNCPDVDDAGGMGPLGTLPGDRAPATARQIEAAALTVELGLNSWELAAVESSGDSGSEYRYRPVGGTDARGTIDVVLVPGGETEFLARVGAAVDVAEVGSLDATTHIASIGVDRYRYTAVLYGFDLDWIVDIDAAWVAGRDAFDAIVSAVTIRHADGRAVNATAEIASGTSVTIPPQTNEPTVLAIGDSVMLGAAQNLTFAGIAVDALASRAFVNGLDLVASVVDSGFIGGPTSSIDTVIIHLGGNGPIQETDLAQMMEFLAPFDVVVLTNGIERDYTEANNDLIRALPSSHANVTVLDWDELRNSCPGDCFEADDIHLTPDGQRFYANLLTPAG